MRNSENISHTAPSQQLIANDRTNLGETLVSFYIFLISWLLSLPLLLLPVSATFSLSFLEEAQ